MCVIDLFLLQDCADIKREVAKTSKAYIQDKTSKTYIQDKTAKLLKRDICL